MGRQPFLTRLALGRSPFEPTTSITQSSEYVQLDPSQQDIPATARESNVNRYIQLYDERGTPINPRAHEHGRRFRQAQNDVLSAIGVVERRPSPSDDLPGSYKERLEQLEEEDMAGMKVAHVSTGADTVCTWWIGSLKARILTFRIRESVPFSHIVASEYQHSGSSLMYTGFPATLVHTASAQVSLLIIHVLRPLDRLLLATRATRKTRLFFQRWKNVTAGCFGLFLEVLFYPFAYHATLQQLGLLSARPLLPSWRSLIPFSPWSPLRLPSLPSGFFAATLVDIAKAVVTSPLVFVCLENILERWVYLVIYEAIATATIHPDNPDFPGAIDLVKRKPRPNSPRLIRNAVNRLLVAMGWARPLPLHEAEEPRRGQVHSVDIEIQRTVEVDGRQITNVSQLHIPTAHSGVRSLANPADAGQALIAPHTAPARPQLASPTASEPSHNGDDPRIRIMSRGSMVEMEVRLPPEVLFSHTEVTGNYPPTSRLQDTIAPAAVEQIPPVYHRVTRLSTEPAHMIGAICRAQIVGWATLPLKAVAFRLIASHYLAGRGNQIGLSSISPGFRILSPLAGLHNLNLRSTGMLLSRLALCGALEVAIDLTLWGLQYVAVTYIGERGFAWGAL